MTEKDIQHGKILKDLQDAKETMQREKITLSPEMKQYFDEEMAKLTGKMSKKEPVYPRDLKFLRKIKEWMQMPEELREKYPGIEAMAKGSIDLVNEMNLDKSYDEMVDTLQNYRYTDKIFDKQTVIKAIINLGPEMLERIKKFNRPTILITPKGDLASKIQKLDANKKYSDSNGQQEDTYFGEPLTSSLWGPEPAKLTVTIVDGAPEMPQLPADKVKLNNKKKHKYLAKEYKKRGMKMITARQYAMLAQKSLRAYEKTQDEKEIIDKNTPIYLNAEHLTDLLRVPYARWASGNRRFYFRLDGPGLHDVVCRGRPSVQVL